MASVQIAAELKQSLKYVFIICYQSTFRQACTVRTLYNWYKYNWYYLIFCFNSAGICTEAMFSVCIFFLVRICGSPFILVGFIPIAIPIHPFIPLGTSCLLLSFVFILILFSLGKLEQDH